jgi:hypothetical protein
VKQRLQTKQREKRGKLSRNLGGGKKRKTLTGKGEFNSIQFI